MNYKPLLIVLGEPRSVFIEIFLKAYKKLRKKIKRPIILIGSSTLVKKQLNYFNYNYKINEIYDDKIKLIKNNNNINLINIDLDVKKPFQKIFNNSNEYIESSFSTAIKLLKKKQAIGLLNGPISKKKFLKKSFSGITEYLKHKTSSNNVAMIIYNKQLSVSPVTTHIPIKFVNKKITKKYIKDKIKLINKFYKKFLKKNPNIAVLGLNPHCETIDSYSEENNIIIPSIKNLKKKGIKISGPFPADTFFIKPNYKKFDLVIGMYHDQVLTPIKSIFKFNAINITVGLPFIRVSPDHGPNETMISKNISDPTSIIQSILFFERNL